jgi:hypothetical protein
MPLNRSRLAQLLAIGCTACAPAPVQQVPSPKVAIELANVNAEGLSGPATGLRAVHYEFCIPASGRHASEVREIDPTAQLMPGSRGRIGCADGEILVLGNTHQRHYRSTLERLAARPYVTRIVESHLE